jgi:hypothetical protein
MSLAQVLQRLERKADTEALLAQLQAKEKEAQAKLDAFNAIMRPYGLESEDVAALQAHFDAIIEKAQQLEDEFEAVVAEEEDIVAELEAEGLSYPFDLDLEFV